MNGFAMVVFLYLKMMNGNYKKIYNFQDILASYDLIKKYISDETSHIFIMFANNSLQQQRNYKYYRF